jgi:hypothetical protein
MRHLELVRQSRRISELFAKTSVASTEDLELQAHWAKYLCILISGLLENSVELLYSEYTRQTSDPAVHRFVTKQLERVLNPNDEALLKVAGSFRKDWRDELEAFMEVDGRKEAINGIINTRNQVAHGRDSGISLVNLKDYYRRVISVVDFIEAQLGI